MADEALNQEPIAQPDTDDAINDGVEDGIQPEGVQKEDTISSLQELAEQMGADVDSLVTLKVPTKVNGQPADVTISDLINSYQIQSAAEQRLADAKAQAQEVKRVSGEQLAAIKSQAGEAAGLVLAAEKLFFHDLQNANLSELREKDYTQYQRVKETMQERRSAIEALKKQVGGSLQQHLQAGKPTPDVVQQEQAALISAIPELENEAARKALGTYVLTQGFDSDEIANAADHRLFVLAEKARRYDELQAKSKTAEKKVTRIPKHLKPAAQKPKPAEEKDAASILYPKH